MLDKRTELVLFAITKKCEEGSYKVLDSADLINQLPKQYKMDNEGLRDIINFLCEREYIKCKYSDNSVYCVAPLPKGRLYGESRVKEKRTRKSVFASTILSLIAAMIGGAMGSFLFFYLNSMFNFI